MSHLLAWLPWKRGMGRVLSKTRMPKVNTAAEPAGLVAELASKFHLPVHEVNETFSDQLRRLEQDARITGFVAVLAARHTRAILRCRMQSPQQRN